MQVFRHELCCLAPFAPYCTVCRKSLQPHPLMGRRQPERRIAYALSVWFTWTAYGSSGAITVDPKALLVYYGCCTWIYLQNNAVHSYSYDLKNRSCTSSNLDTFEKRERLLEKYRRLTTNNSISPAVQLSIQFLSVFTYSTPFNVESPHISRSQIPHISHPMILLTQRSRSSSF